jgi:hypothetical protein
MLITPPQIRDVASAPTTKQSVQMCWKIRQLTQERVLRGPTD